MVTFAEWAKSSRGCQNPINGLLNSFPDFIRDRVSSTDCCRRLLRTYLSMQYWCIQHIWGFFNDNAPYKCTYSLSRFWKWSLNGVWMLGLTRRQRIDKYLDTRRLIATAADHVATDRSGKSQSQDVGLPESLKPLLWLVQLKPVVGDHQRRGVCCYVENLHFCMHNLLLSNVKVIF